MNSCLESGVGGVCGGWLSVGGWGSEIQALSWFCDLMEILWPRLSGLPDFFKCSHSTEPRDSKIEVLSVRPAQWLLLAFERLAAFSFNCHAYIESVPDTKPCANASVVDPVFHGSGAAPSLPLRLTQCYPSAHSI